MKVVEKVLAISDKKKRYDYLYDLICDYLDQEFRSRNICGFHCGICRRRQDMIERNIKKDTYQDGCCYRYSKNESCQYLIPGVGCSIKNIACKTFTCFYLRKRGYRFQLHHIYLARYFFNVRQKFFMENTYFVDKNVMMKGILRRG
ncbi:MAG: hypothetical protein PUB18_00995 [bacterium]|nr:hypothetical protein [bacterium]